MRTKTLGAAAKVARAIEGSAPARTVYMLRGDGDRVFVTAGVETTFKAATAWSSGAVAFASPAAGVWTATLDTDGMRRVLALADDVNVHGDAFVGGGGTVPFGRHTFEDMPPMPTFEPNVTELDDVDALGTLLPFTASGNDARAVLTGIHVHYGTAAATDTYRLGTARLRSLDAEGIVPSHVVAAIVRSRPTSVALRIGPDRTVGTWTAEHGPKRDRVTLFASVNVRNVEGPFPNYGSLFPDDRGTAAVVDGPGTAEAFTALSKVVGKTNTPAVVEQRPTGVYATVSVDGATAERALPWTVDGELPTVAVNPAYAADVFAFVGPGGTVGIRDGMKALAMGTADASREALLMPMRVA